MRVGAGFGVWRIQRREAIEAKAIAEGVLLKHIEALNAQTDASREQAAALRAQTDAIRQAKELPQSVSFIDLAKIARDQFGSDFKNDNEFMDFTNGLGQAHLDKRFVIQGRKGCVGGSVPDVVFQTRLHEDIPRDHFLTHWIYAYDFFGSGDEDNKRVFTDNPNKIVPESGRYGDLQISNRALALAWLEHDADRLKGKYKQAVENDQTKREAQCANSSGTTGLGQ